MEAELHKAQRQLNQLSQQISTVLETLQGILSSTQYQHVEHKLLKARDITIQAYYDTILASSNSEQSE
jgi:hypothetical protein